MKKANDKINEFLYSIAMHSDLTDMQTVTEQFTCEMDKGLRGEASSLQMIPTYINASGEVPDDVPVITIDAGGTNLRTGLLTFTGGIPQISSFEKCAMPGSRHEISADEFFDELAEKILPLTDKSDKIGFCFSYPAEVYPSRDAKILCLSKKEVSVRNSEGLMLGENLMKKLREKGVRKSLGITILNDTVASLMGGIASMRISECDGIAGLIVGTGNNTCYAEKGSKITKLSGANDMIINCESGNFSKAIRGTSDKLIDSVSENPGTFFFEKMLSGVYLGKIITNTASMASKEGLLSGAFKEVFPHFTTPELDDFLRGIKNRVLNMCVGDDADVLRIIIDDSFERAAKLVCANIAAICLHCDGGKNAEHPFCVIAEGSVFNNSLLFKDKLNKHVAKFIEGDLSRHIVFHTGENLTLTGAALAALLN